MQKDYMMRIIEQFVQAILTITRYRKGGENKEARQLARTAANDFLKIDIDLLCFFAPDQIMHYFTDFSNQIETDKCVLAADLFYELALIEEAEGQPATALHLKMLCLHLLTIAIPKDLQFQQPQYYEKVALLANALKDQSTSETVLENLRYYNEFLIKSVTSDKQMP